MRAKQLRSWARENLKGRWLTAAFVCLVGSLLTNGLDLVSGLGQGTAIQFDASEGFILEQGGATGLLDFIARDTWAMLLTITIASVLLAIVVGGAVTLGMAKFNLNLIHRRKAKFTDVFSQFHRLGAGFAMQFMLGLLVVLWSLLLIFPGIIAAYSYAMTPYLMAEFPDLRVMDAIRESKRLMRGNKWRLFCLQFSFIGWELLGLCTPLGIGCFWVNAYRSAAQMAFYMDVTGRGGLRDYTSAANVEF